MQKKLRKISRIVFTSLAVITGAASANSQCLPPSGWSGCPKTDFTNAFMASTNNAETLEYDNWVSGFHASAIRNGDGTFSIWGESMTNAGTGGLITPQPVNNVTYPSLTGTPLKIAVGGWQQAVILTTDGLFVVGKTGHVLSLDVINTPAFTKLTSSHILNGQATTALPPGVTPNSVKMLFASTYTLAITTCDGHVWMLSATAPLRGGGNGSTSSKTWYQVKRNLTGTEVLDNIVATRGNGSEMMALDASGNLWTWGQHVFKGDGVSASITSGFAIPLTAPSLGGASIKMIGTTNGRSTYSPNASEGEFANKGATYYVLATDGKLYALGNNTHRQLGNWNNISSLDWVRPTYSSGGTPMDDIKWISPQEHFGHLQTSGQQEGAGAINVLTNDGRLFNWGFNRRGMLGRADTDNGTIRGTIQDPSEPTSGSGSHANAFTITSGDKFNGVETGGHTTMIIKSCENQLIYGGHRIGGSMGNAIPIGDFEDDREQYYFTQVNTPVVGICSAEPVVIVPDVAKICNGEPFTLTAIPAGGTFTLASGSATVLGSTFTPTAGNDDPISVTYAGSACSASKTITLYKRDYGNLGSAWPVSSATILGSAKAWLGIDAATSECLTSTSDAADGFALTVGSISGAGTQASPWQISNGTTYNAIVTVNGSVPVKNVYWAVWYDVDGNGSFKDAEDLFFKGTTAHGSPVSAPAVPITIPSSTVGSGAIRVVATSVATDFTKMMNGQVEVVNGEVEDYYVLVSALPVKLVSFDGRAEQNTVQLSWTTTEEVNANHFEIERSGNAKTWNKIGVNEAAGESASLVKYDFADVSPLNGINYYRLKMVDKDVTFAYSSVISVKASGELSNVILYPNPTSDVLNLKTDEGNPVNLSDVTQVTVTDVTGKVVYKSNGISGQGINLKGLANGIYQVKITTKGGALINRKIVVGK